MIEPTYYEGIIYLTTPQGTKFLDIPSLEGLTSYPVRSHYKQPNDPDILPRADALIAFPVTFNTLNKWALGITDTLAVGLLCEYTGLKFPMVAVPATGEGLSSHPALARSVRMLRRYGVCLIYEPKCYPPKNQVSTEVILDELHQLLQK